MNLLRKLFCKVGKLDIDFSCVLSNQYLHFCLGLFYQEIAAF